MKLITNHHYSPQLQEVCSRLKKELYDPEFELLEAIAHHKTLDQTAHLLINTSASMLEAISLDEQVYVNASRFQAPEPFFMHGILSRRPSHQKKWYETNVDFSLKQEHRVLASGRFLGSSRSRLDIHPLIGLRVADAAMCKYYSDMQLIR